MAKKKTKPADETSFEESFEALKSIVSGLEEGNLSLSQSLQNYEAGIQRLKECYGALNSAEQKIRQLAKIDEDGNLIVEQFESGTTESAGQKKTKSKKRANNPDADNELF